MAKLIRVKVVVPIQLFGRICGSGERLYLDERDALPLIESGHVAEVPGINGAPVPPGRWTEPTTR